MKQLIERFESDLKKCEEGYMKGFPTLLYGILIHIKFTRDFILKERLLKLLYSPFRTPIDKEDETISKA